QTTAIMSDLLEGYTWPNRHLMVSKKASEQIEALLQQSDNRNPDFHDMYVYNDFHGYGVCHLIVSELKKIHKALSGKEQDIDEAWILLESLVVLMETESGWSMVDDPDLPYGIVSVLCSAIMTVVNALKEQGKFNRESIPNVEHVLRTAYFCGPLEDFDGGPGENWLNAIIFLKEIKKIVREELEPTDEVKEQEKKWYEAWKTALNEKTRKAIEKAEEEDGDEDEGNREDEWYLSGDEADAPAPKAATFKFTTWYNKLQKHLKEVPVYPLRGPPEWDLTKWTKEERAPFAFGAGMDSEDESGEEDLADLPGGVKELLEELAKRGQMDAEDFSGEDDEDEEDEEEEEEERPQKRQKQSGGQAKGKQPAKNQPKANQPKANQPKANQPKANQPKGNQQKGGQQKGGPKKGPGNRPKGKPPGAAKGKGKK
ncbi:hypothetical protein SAICODRAFT_62224, partial [Saitoella complicata NRRL Y-17804]|uniref:uncharacterized protein n=1 Tax=Saitoella complicata (strain BCRC 22490 / CBS 7301 / JCM 7358 / NBRC 10748 / NRRL Y-17804) TaxID=698492 RepID=UPI000866E0DC